MIQDPIHGGQNRIVHTRCDIKNSKCGEEQNASGEISNMFLFFGFCSYDYIKLLSFQKSSLKDGFSKPHGNKRPKSIIYKPRIIKESKHGLGL